MKFGRVYQPGGWGREMGIAEKVRRVCLIPNVSGVGGMVSFRGRIAKGFAGRGVEITFDLRDHPYQAVLVIGGTRDLAGLWRVRQQGIPIIQRLDGMNWIHRKTHTGWRHYLRAEYGNLILSLIRSRLASQIIYQSEFSHEWWEREYGKTRAAWHVVHNGVDLEQYNPAGKGEIPTDHVRILLVEGTIGGGYEFGLHTALQLGEQLQAENSSPMEIMVVGQVAESVQQTYRNGARKQVSFLGQLPMERIPELDRSAHVLYAADLNPACPNSVIEALACGLPVAGFDTGALAEIITPACGAIVPYGGDPWKLDPPDIVGLARSVQGILENQAVYRTAARERAEQRFGLERMVQGYLDVLNL
jgi:glycosyltransferase involved in cell wall biosynthesis